MVNSVLFSYLMRIFSMIKSIISYQYGIMVVFCTKAMCLYRIMLVPAALQTIYVGTGTHSLPRTEHCSTQYYQQQQQYQQQGSTPYGADMCMTTSSGAILNLTQTSYASATLDATTDLLLSLVKQHLTVNSFSQNICPGKNISVEQAYLEANRSFVRGR